MCGELSLVDFAAIGGFVAAITFTGIFVYTKVIGRKSKELETLR